MPDDATTTTATTAEKRGRGRPPNRAITPTTSVEYFTPSQIALLKKQILKPRNREATDDELALFAAVCQRTGLDPFSRQIYAVFRNTRQSDGSYSEQMVIQTGIDGYRSIAQRTGEHAGTDDVVFVPPDESQERPTKATVTVYRIVKGVRVPFTATARWNEYKQTDRQGNLTDMWQRMPYGQLGKCAESLALRKGFSVEVGIVRTQEEMDQADNIQPPVIDAATMTVQNHPQAIAAQAPKAEASAKPQEREKVAPPSQEPSKLAPSSVATTQTPPSAIKPETQQALQATIAKAVGSNATPELIKAFRDLSGKTRSAELSQDDALLMASMIQTIGVEQNAKGKWVYKPKQEGNVI